MQRIMYIIQKEFRQILHEKMYLGLIFGMPFIQIVVLGFAITTDVTNVPMAVVDYDHSSMSRRLTEAFSVTESFNYRGHAAGVDEALKRMDEGRIQLAVVIPEHFERDLKRGRTPTVQAILDGVDGNSAGVALSYANQITLKLQRNWMLQSGVDDRKLQNMHLVQLDTRMWYNPSLQSVNNIVPGIIAVLLMAVTAFLTGITIVREKEIGTLEQLMVTPIKKVELIIGKVVPMLVIAFLLFNVGILASGLIFNLWLKGNLFTLYLLAMIFSMCTLGLGILASTVARTQQQAMFIAWFFMVFAMLLSGFFIPIENMPDVIQWITYLNPVRYFMVIIREIYLKGTGLMLLIKEGLALLAFGLIMIVMATSRFQKRIS